MAQQSPPSDGEIRALQDRLAEMATFPAAGPVVCAVSGGADSLALLVLARHVGLTVTAVHVDHGLREHSADEADVVAEVVARFGAAFRSERVVVDPGPNLEARARAARYAVLPPDVLTGHTLDDQAETMILNLMRGAGLHGMAGMRSDVRRPLLGLRRADTHALCDALGLRPVIDPSNDDPAFRRNRVRHEVLPLLAEVAGRDVAPILARQAALFANVADLVDAQAATLDPTDAHALARAPEVLATAAIRQWLRPLLHGAPPDQATVARVMAVAHGECRATEVTGGWRVRRSAGRLRLEPPTPV